MLNGLGASKFLKATGLPVNLVELLGRYFETKLMHMYVKGT